MELRVLGPIEVVAGSRSIDVGSRRHRAVLSMLVMDIGRTVSIDRLIDGLWGDDPPPTAAKALHVYVSGLRKALEADRGPGQPFEVVVTRPPGYVLQLAPEAVDAVRFEALVAEARDLLDAEAAENAHEALGRGLALWRGSAYQDLAFEPFLQAEIARLEELRASGAEARVEALLALGRHDDAVVQAEALVAEDALRERRWALLALALYRNARQGEALRALDRARRTLGEELGVDPGPDLRRLETDILTHSPALELPLPKEQPVRAALRVPAKRSDVGILSVASAVAVDTSRATPSGTVLPPDATPSGYTLSDVAAAVAQFQMSGNDPAQYPDTPFQILYLDAVDVQPLGSGVIGVGSKSVTVPEGTTLFVPLYMTNDAPVVVEPFPVAPDEAAPYLFSPEITGARDFEVIVDGTSTPIGPEYVTGPFPYEAEEGAHIVVLSAFLHPLNPGTHSVIVRGGLFGSAWTKVYGISFLQEELTYNVEVKPAR